MITFIPPDTQTFESLAFVGSSVDCTCSQLVLTLVNNDGNMSSSKDCHKLSLTLA